MLQDAWIISKTTKTANLLPGIRKEFDARSKFREAVEIVKLNNRIKKLKHLYATGEDDDSDLVENSLSNSLNSSMASLSIDGNRSNDFKTDPKPVSYTHLDVYKRQRIHSEIRYHIKRTCPSPVPFPDFRALFVLLRLKQGAKQPNDRLTFWRI